MPKNDKSKPIADYALIGDMRSCALVAKDGSVDWLCLPRHDSPAIFLRLLDPRGGCCQVRLRNLRSTARRYVPETNVLETTFCCETGTLVVSDFMPVRAKDRPLDEGPDSSSSGALVRSLHCVEGMISARVFVRPTFDYARRPAMARRASQTDVTFSADGRGEMSLRVSSSHEIAASDVEAFVDFELREGRKGHLVLSDGATAGETVDTLLQQTLAYWRGWSDRCSYRGDFRDAVLRSALCLKLLTYAPSGAIVAAATAGLPEAVGGPRNWDYRLTWMRDASFTVGAFLNLGYRREAAEFLRFLLSADDTRGKHLRVLYPIEGDCLPEEALDHLEGWEGSRPVLIGNDAADQDQHDIYGEFLSALRLYLDEAGYDDVAPIHGHLPDLVRELAEVVERKWSEPDRGIWEIRSKPGHLFHSKAMCWLALDSAASIASRLGLPEVDRIRWLAVRDQIAEELRDRGWDESRQSYVAGYELRELDAAVLRCTLFGAIDADDPRLQRTIEAIERELTIGPHVYRYRMDDGLAGDEGAFFACSFWLAGNWALQGRTVKARGRIAELIASANDVGLLSEEIDPRTGDLLGNFPQGFSHMALINGAVRLERSIARFGQR